MAPENVVDKAGAGLIGHSGDREFAVIGGVECPACFFEQEVDESIAGFGFVVVVVVRDLDLLGGGDLGAEGGKFGLEIGVGGVRLAEGVVFGAELVGEGLDLGDRLGGDRGSFGEGVGLKFELGGGFVGGAESVVVAEPVADVEEFLEGGDRLLGGDRFVAVDGVVAEATDEVAFGVEGGSDQAFEAGFKEEGGEVGFVGEGEPIVAFKEPVDGGFEGAAAVEAGGAGIGVGALFGFGGSFVETRPFGFEVLEVAHGDGRWVRIKIWL